MGVAPMSESVRALSDALILDPSCEDDEAIQGLSDRAGNPITMGALRALIESPTETPGLRAALELIYDKAAARLAPTPGTVLAAVNDNFFAALLDELAALGESVSPPEERP